MGTLKFVPVGGKVQEKFWRDHFTNSLRRPSSFRITGVPLVREIENCCAISLLHNFRVLDKITQMRNERAQDKKLLTLLKKDYKACQLNAAISSILYDTSDGGVWENSEYFDEEAFFEGDPGTYPFGPGAVQAYLNEMQVEEWEPYLLQAGFEVFMEPFQNFNHYDPPSYVTGYVAYHPLAKSS